MDLLFIQPWDRPWTNKEYVAKRQKMYVSRAQFEVGLQVPDKYSFTCLDLNVEVKAGQSVTQAVTNAMKEYKPRVVLLTMPVYVLGMQLEEIIKAIKLNSFDTRIILGGSEIALIHDLPLTWWPEVTCCYNGYGHEVQPLLDACLSDRQLPIDGVYWQGESSNGVRRGEARLADNYTPEEFYTARGRLDFANYLTSCRNAGVSPMGIIEMGRGCKFRCSFCALNKERLGFSERAPQTVLREAYFLAEQGIEYLHLIDPTLGLDRESTGQLLDELSSLHQQYPRVEIEILTRPEFVTGEFAAALRKAGVSRCAIGMETMDEAELTDVRKALKPDNTRQAVYHLAEQGIETKLFHIVFPDHLSTATVRFLLELSSEGLPFIVQTSFLRALPNRQSKHPFITQDQTVYVPGQDTLEQLMEWMLVNLAFPSMDIGGGGDQVLQNAVAEKLRRGRSLASLFKIKKGGHKVRLKRSLWQPYGYTHRDGQSVSSCLC